MKKLLIAISAIVLAVSAKAAQYNWAINADGEYSNTATYYVFAGGDNVGTSLAAILTSSGAAAFETALSGYTYQTGTLASGKANGVITGVTGSYSTVFFFDDGVDAGNPFAYIVYDASDYVYTPPTSSPGTLDMYGSDYGDTEYAESWGSGTVAVPEPTSGLLMLLGLAGLALKRKKA